MHHNRVRRVDARTRIITTVAGTGQWGYAGDGGPATPGAAGRARRASPWSPSPTERSRSSSPTTTTATSARSGLTASFATSATTGAWPSARRRAWRSHRSAARLAVCRRFEPATRSSPLEHSARSRRTSVAAADPPRPAGADDAAGAPGETTPSLLPGHCRSCGRTGGAWRSLAVLLLVGDRARRAAALAAEGRHRLRARRPADSASRSRHGCWRSHERQSSSCWSTLVVAGVRAADREPDRVGLQHAGPGRYGPAHGLRPALPAVPAPAGAGAAASHHDEYRRRGLPRRRRRLRDREPGDERHLPAGHVGRRRWS